MQAMAPSPPLPPGPSSPHYARYNSTTPGASTSNGISEPVPASSIDATIAALDDPATRDGLEALLSSIAGVQEALKSEAHGGDGSSSSSTVLPVNNAAASLSGFALPGSAGLPPLPQGSPPSAAPLPSSSSSEDKLVEMKKRYLARLPLARVIDICLRLDAQAPEDVRSRIWPHDLEAAIASLPAFGSSISTTSAADEPPPSATAPPASSSTAPAPAVAAGATPPNSAPPFGYSAQNYPYQFYNSSQQSYFQPTAQQTWNAQQPQHQQPAAGAAPAPAMSMLAPPQPMPSLQGIPPHPVPPDDLPSYEEMIAMALKDIDHTGDGAAPKTLFNWMAIHFAVQTNFRPSASQALQKAFKRGRLSKKDGGRYALNPLWEGGAVRFFFFPRTLFWF